MKVMIMGCGRLGSRLAVTLEGQGHEVTVLDTNATSFRRLPASFGGTRAIGNGMDQHSLERAGIESMDAFLAVTQGDNRNFFASQLAREVYHVPRVICRIYDPVREEIFRDIGLETFSPTSVGTKVMVEMLVGPAAKAGV